MAGRTIDQEWPGTTEVRARSVQGLDAFLALEPEWRALADRVHIGNPFLSWEWVSEWGRSFWDDQLVTVLVSCGSVPVAIAPFFRGPSLPVLGLRAKHLELLGPRWGQNLLEMGTVLLDPAYAAAALEVAVDCLWGKDDWDWIEVLAFGDDLPAWNRALDRTGVRSRISVEKVSEVPVMRLGEGWEELRPRLKRNVKESIRRAYNAPRRDGVVYNYREQRNATGLDAVLDDFFRLHRARAMAPGSRPHADHFARPRAQQFLRQVAPRLAAAGILNISVCEAHDTCVAIRINLEMDGTLYLYYSGFDPGWAHYNVMTYTTTEAIKSAMAHRLRNVNFSPGVDQAKARWDVTMRPLIRFAIVADRRQSRALFAMYRVLRKASRWRRTEGARIIRAAHDRIRAS